MGFGATAPIMITPERSAGAPSGWANNAGAERRRCPLADGKGRVSLPAVLWVARATLRARATPQCRRTAERLRHSNLRTGKQRQADKTARAALLGQRYTACAMMCKQGYMRAHCVISSIDTDCIRVWRGLHHQ